MEPLYPAAPGLSFNTAPAGLLADDDAAVLQRDLPSLAGEDLMLAQAKLNEHSSFRAIYPRPLSEEEQAARVGEYDRLDEVFQDFDKATQGQPLETVRAADPADQPAVKQMLASQAFARFQTGQVWEGADWETNRDALADKLFDGRGKGSDTAFHGEVKGWFDRNRAVKEQRQSFADAGVADALNLDDTDFTKRLAEMQESAKLVEGMEGERDANVKAYTDARNAMNAKVAPYRGEAKKIMAAMKLASGKVEGGTDIDVGFDPTEKAIDLLASVPEDARPALIAMFAKKPGKDESSGAVKGINAFGRGLAGQLTGMASTARRRAIGDFAADLRKDTPVEIPAQFMGDPDGLRKFVKWKTGGALEDVAGEAGQPTVASPEQRAQLAELTAMEATRNVVATQIKGVIEGTIDPIKGVGMSGRIGVGIASSMGAMIPSFASAPIALTVAQGGFAEQEFSRQINQGTPPEQAHQLAEWTGAVQAGLDHAQALFAFKLPWLKGMTAAAPLSRVGGSAAAQATIGVAGVQAAEYGIEIAQDAVPIATAAAAEALGMDLPEAAQYQEEWKRWDGLNPDTFLTLLPLSLIGGGFQGISNAGDSRRFQAELLADPVKMAAVGINPDTAASIADMAPQQRAEAYRQAYLTRTPDAPAAVEARAAVAAQSVQDKAMAADQQAEAGVSAVRRTADGWAVDREDGTSVPVDTAGAAAALVNDLRQANTLAEAEALVSITDQWADKAPEGEGRTTAFTGALAIGDNTGITYRRNGKDTRLELDARSLKTLREEIELTTGGADADAVGLVNGRNWSEFQERVADNSRELIRALEVNRSAEGVLTLVHEQVESVFRAGAMAGTITPRETLAAIQSVAPALDPAVLGASDVEGRAFRERVQRVAAGQGTETEIRETVSELVVADVLGRRKDGGLMPAGSITAAVESAINATVEPGARRALGKFLAFLKAVRTHFRAVFGTAAALRKARRDGKVKPGGDWEAFVDKLLEVDVQRKNDEQLADEVRQYVPPTPEQEAEGIAFSVSPLRVKQTRAQLIKATEDSADWKDWYQRHEDTLTEFFGTDADLFQRILSVTSQAATVKANVGLALKAYGQLKRGEEFTGYLPAVIKNLGRVRDDVQVAGQKIAAYQEANTGAEDTVVVDRHISRMLFGVDSPSAKQFKKGQEILTQIAGKLGWKPRQVQASMWAASIRKAGNIPESYDSYLRTLHARGTLLERIGSVVPGDSGLTGAGASGGSGAGTGPGASEGVGQSFSVSAPSRFDEMLAREDAKRAAASSGQPWRVDGQQGGFASAADDAPWVPDKFQQVTILDTSHPAVGSTLLIPKGEDIQAAIDEKRAELMGSSFSTTRAKKGGDEHYPSERFYEGGQFMPAPDSLGSRKAKKELAKYESFASPEVLDPMRPGDKWILTIKPIYGGDVSKKPKAILRLDSAEDAADALQEAEWMVEDRLGMKSTRPGAQSFSVSPVKRLDAVMTQLDNALARDPDARRKLAREANARLQALAFSWTTERQQWNGTARPLVEPRTRKSLDKEQAFREAAAYAEAEEAVMNTLTPEAQAALGMTAEDTSAYAGPLAQRFTGGRFGTKGRIKTQREALRESVAGDFALGGEYDGAAGLPPMFFGGAITPDQAADEAHRAGEIADAFPDTLWEAMRKELGSQAKGRAALNEATAALKDAQKQARATAREAAFEWRREEDAKQAKDYSPKASLLRDMRTLDAILSVMPAEIRAKVGGFIKLASLSTDAARAREIGKRIDKMAPLVEKYLKAETVAGMERLMDQAKPDREGGKSSRGKLGADGHRFFDEVGRVFGLTKEQADAELVALEAQLQAPDQTREQQLDLGERLQVLIAFGAFKEKSAAEMDASYRLAQDVYANKRNAWRTLEEARLAEVAALAADTIKALGGASIAGTQAGKAAAAKARGIVSGLALDLKSFTEVMDALLGEGHPLARRWSRMAREGYAQKNDDIRALRARWRDALEAATGKRGVKARRVLWDMGQGQPITVQTGGTAVPSTLKVPVAVIDGWADGSADPAALGFSQEEVDALTADRAAMEDGDRRESLPLERVARGAPETVNMSEAEAVFLTLLAGQEQYTEALTRAGWDATALAAVQAAISPAARSLRAFLSKEYADGYAPLAAVFERMYGVALPQIKNYAPAAFYHQGAEREMDPNEAGGQGGMRAGFLANRKKHAAVPRLENAFATFFGHAAQTAHWKGLAEMVREFSGVMNNPEVKRAIEGRHGPDMLKTVSEWTKSIEGNGLQVAAGRLDRAVGWITSAQAYIALSWKLGTLMKQSSAVLGAAYRMPVGAYAKGFAKLMTGQLEGKAMFNSPVIQRRLETGFAPEVRAAMNDIWNAKPTRRRALIEGGMNFIGLVDAFFTTGSAAIAYDHHLKQAKAGGMNDTDAAAHAMAEVEDIVGRTAQPADAVDRSLVEQRLNAFGKLAFMFASEARQKSSMWLKAIGNTITGKATAEDVRVLLISHLIVGPMMQGITAAWRDARDDDDDELFDSHNWDPMDFLKAAVAGPLAGIPLLRDVASGFTSGGPFSRFVTGGKSLGALVKDPGKEPLEYYTGHVTKIMQATSAELGVLGSVVDQAFDLGDNVMNDPAELAKQRKSREAREKRERKTGKD